MKDESGLYEYRTSCPKCGWNMAKPPEYRPAVSEEEFKKRLNEWLKRLNEWLPVVGQDEFLFPSLKDEAGLLTPAPPPPGPERLIWRCDCGYEYWTKVKAAE